MKKAEKLFSVLLMVAMLVTSAGLLYASLYASGSGTQSTFSSVVFEKETGIRYNNLTKEFEVFNEAGVSWIGANRSISIDGDIKDQWYYIGRPEYSCAMPSSRYNIMCDIAYTGNIIGENIYNTDFDSNKITLTSGVLDGRGFTLKNFRVTTITLEGQQIATALVASNGGTIRNLNISNADVNFGGTEADAAGILCGVNKGTIDNCSIYGREQNNTYSSSLFTGLYGVAGINMGRITNTTNNSNLENTNDGESLVAGIASVKDDLADTSRIPHLLNNVNNGNMTSTNGRAAGIAMDTTGAEFTVRGNINNGNLSALISASGIIDGGVELRYLTAKNNALNGSFLGQASSYPLYYGVASNDGINIPKPPDYGIRWKQSLNSGAGGFEIYTMDGISWMCYDAYFDVNGTMLDAGDTGAFQASQNAYYEIADEIANGVGIIDYNSKTKLYNKAFNGYTDGNPPTLGQNGVFYGKGVLLNDFIVRNCGVYTSPHVNFASGFFYKVVGLVKEVRIKVATPSKTILSVYTNSYVGGIVGDLDSKGAVLDCEVSGVIDCESNGIVGGIVGQTVGWPVHNNVHSKLSTIDRCVVTDATIHGRVVGGIVGSATYAGGGPGIVLTVSFSGELYGTYSGGIFGRTAFVNPDATSKIDVKGMIGGTYTGLLVGSLGREQVLNYTRGRFTDSTFDAFLGGVSECDGLFGYTYNMYA